MQTLWVHAGIGNSVRDIPIHILTEFHGEELCAVLPALHHLTGADYTSKVGTKLKALKSDPEKFLQSFGKGK